jgi:hypothetical protein
VHQWLASAAHRTYAYLDAAEQERVLYWATRDCGRDPQFNEIERTVENIRRKRGSGEAASQYYKPWPSPVPEAIDEIVCGSIVGSNLLALSPQDLYDGVSLSRNGNIVPCYSGGLNPGSWLLQLFPSGSNLCLGQECLYYASPGEKLSIYRKWRTRRRDSWVNEECGICRGYDLIVPNPAQFTWHYAIAGHRSTRCEAMFPKRR